MENRPTDNLSSYLESVVFRVVSAEDDAEASEVLRESAAEIRECINAERLSAATRMAAWLAHKVNNPLGTISGNAQLLARRLERDISDEDALRTYRRYIEAIQGQTERCAQITGELLEFTRSRDVELGTVNLIQTIEEAVELACYNRGQNKVTVETVGGIPEVRTDKELLVRVLYEVIVNAIYAIPDDGSITVRCGVRPSSGDGGESVEIEVTDSGPGIPEGVLPKVFDPFFSTRENARGLGLTTSLAIMRQLGGTLEIGKTGPDGTSVLIQFPLRRP